MGVGGGWGLGVLCVGLGWTGWGVFFCFMVLVSCDGGDFEVVGG